MGWSDSNCNTYWCDARKALRLRFMVVIKADLGMFLIWQMIGYTLEPKDLRTEGRRQPVGAEILISRLGPITCLC
jgi:hypothetical protein